MDKVADLVKVVAILVVTAIIIGFFLGIIKY